MAQDLHAAYHMKAPSGVNASLRAGQVKARMKLKPQVVAVAKDIPTSRIYNGNAWMMNTLVSQCCTA